MVVVLLVVVGTLPGKLTSPPPPCCGWNWTLAWLPKLAQVCGFKRPPKSIFAPPLLLVGRAKLLSAWLKIPPIRPPNALLFKSNCFPAAAPLGGWVVGVPPAGRVNDERRLNASLWPTAKKFKKNLKKCKRISLLEITMNFHLVLRWTRFNPSTNPRPWKKLQKFQGEIFQ